jgi:hypothetical protein
MTDTLLGIGRRHWRSFVPIWLFPIAFLSTVALPGFASRAREYFLCFDFPTFLICGYVRTRYAATVPVGLCELCDLKCMSKALVFDDRPLVDDAELVVGRVGDRGTSATNLDAAIGYWNTSMYLPMSRWLSGQSASR